MTGCRLRADNGGSKEYARQLKGGERSYPGHCTRLLLTRDFGLALHLHSPLEYLEITNCDHLSTDLTFHPPPRLAGFLAQYRIRGEPGKLYLFVGGLEDMYFYYLADCAAQYY